MIPRLNDLTIFCWWKTSGDNLVTNKSGFNVKTHNVQCYGIRPSIVIDKTGYIEYREMVLKSHGPGVSENR